MSSVNYSLNQQQSLLGAAANILPTLMAGSPLEGFLGSLFTPLELG